MGLKISQGWVTLAGKEAPYRENLEQIEPGGLTLLLPATHRHGHWHIPQVLREEHDKEDSPGRESHHPGAGISQLRDQKPNQTPLWHSRAQKRGCFSHQSCGGLLGMNRHSELDHLWGGCGPGTGPQNRSTCFSCSISGKNGPRVPAGLIPSLSLEQLRANWKGLDITMKLAWTEPVSQGTFLSQASPSPND